MRTPPVFVLVLLAAAGGILSACGSSTTTSVTSPSTLTRCAVTLNGPGNVPASGGSGRITVSAARECTWSASTDGSWLSLKSDANGQGEGAIEFAAVANPDPAVRRGAVVLNDQRVEITQAAGECSYSLSASGASFGSAGGSGQIDVRASSALCTWTAQSDAEWITVRADGSGRGSAAVPFDVGATTGVGRTGTIRAAGQLFTVTQTEGCAFTISPASVAVGAGGGSGTVTLTTTPTCPWTAASAASWLTISPASGTGGGVLTYVIAGASAERSGTAAIGGQTFTVTQSAPTAPTPTPTPSPAPTPPPAPPPPGPPSPPSCTFNVDPRSVTAGANGGDTTVSVTTGPTCTWTAASSAPWVTLSAAGSTGSAPIRLVVAPTNGASRTATAKNEKREEKKR